MKVLCINDYGYLFGGAEILAHDLAGALRARGHEVRWLTSRSRGGGTLATVARDARPFHDDWRCHGVTRGGPVARGAQQIFNPSAARTLRRALGEWRPDVVHLHGYLGRLSPAILRPLAGVPTVATLHNYRAICPKGTKTRPDGAPCETPWGAQCVASGCLSVAAGAQEKLKRLLCGEPLRGIGRLLAPSRFMKAIVERETGRTVEYFPNATALHSLRVPKRTGKKQILYAGRLAETKGVDILLAALARLPDARLVVAGDGPERTRLERASGGRTHFVGHVDRGRLAELHAESEVMVLPSTWPENAPLAILESLALGTPVVTTDVGGSAELVRDGIEGRVVPARDPERLAQALGAILGDDALRRRMEAHCLVSAENYRLDAAASRLEAIYRESVERSLTTMRSDPPASFSRPPSI